MEERLRSSNFEFGIEKTGARSKFAIRNSQFGMASFHAPERRIHIRIVPPEPVAEAWLQELLGRSGGSAFHDVVVSVEKVGRVLGVGRHRAESRKAFEDRGGPFPAVADQIVHAPGTRAGREGADGYRVPT